MVIVVVSVPPHPQYVLCTMMLLFVLSRQEEVDDAAHHDVPSYY